MANLWFWTMVVFGIMLFVIWLLANVEDEHVDP